MRKTAVMAIGLLFGGMLVVPSAAVAARATEGACQGSGTQAGAGELHAFAPLADCGTTVVCPKKHQGDCAIDLAGTISGDGVVGLVLSAGSEVVDDCSGPLTCEVGGAIKLRPGKRTEIRCEFGEGAAAQTAIECKWSYS